MTQHNFSLTRRQTLQGMIGVSAIALLPACRGNLAPAIAADALLDKISYNLLAHEPERATALGVDTGEYAAFRGKLSDISSDGLAAYAKTLEADLAEVRSEEHTSEIQSLMRISYA